MAAASPTRGGTDGSPHGNGGGGGGPGAGGGGGGGGRELPPLAIGGEGKDMVHEILAAAGPGGIAQVQEVRQRESEGGREGGRERGGEGEKARRVWRLAQGGRGRLGAGGGGVGGWERAVLGFPEGPAERAAHTPADEPLEWAVGKGVGCLEPGPCSGGACSRRAGAKG